MYSYSDDQQPYLCSLQATYYQAYFQKGCFSYCSASSSLYYLLLVKLPLPSSISQLGAYSDIKFEGINPDAAFWGLLNSSRVTFGVRSYREVRSDDMLGQADLIWGNGVQRMGSFLSVLQKSPRAEAEYYSFVRSFLDYANLKPFVLIPTSMVSLSYEFSRCRLLICIISFQSFLSSLLLLRAYSLPLLRAYSSSSFALFRSRTSCPRFSTSLLTFRLIYYFYRMQVRYSYSCVRLVSLTIFLSLSSSSCNYLFSICSSLMRVCLMLCFNSKFSVRSFPSSSFKAIICCFIVSTFLICSSSLSASTLHLRVFSSRSFLNCWVEVERQMLEVVMRVREFVRSTICFQDLSS